MDADPASAEVPQDAAVMPPPPPPPPPPDTVSSDAAAAEQEIAAVVGTDSLNGYDIDVSEEGDVIRESLSRLTSTQ